MEDKVIVTNRSALTKKYGSAGVTKISSALSALVKADKKRGIETSVVYLDDAKAMKKLKAKAVSQTTSARAFKEAIDGVFKAKRPDYLMILGAPDVVPHQDLDNPVYSPNDDDDKTAWGDLPYACDAAYSRDPAKFSGPTRVVSRLPDLTGATNPAHLLGLLRTATSWRKRPADDYKPYFGLSADVWKGSTGMSLEAVFGDHSKLLLAPPQGPKYPKGELCARIHFINCHGAQVKPEFYGQKGSKYPVSLTTAAIGGAITEGSVAAVECCYGAELYDSVTLAMDMPICQSYLAQGAYAYFGSTTIAYGPPDDNSAADLICQYFLLSLLDGASVGRATLMARQQFVEHAAQLDPIDLKTLAQFCAYGDPSVHPILPAETTGVPKGMEMASAERFFRSERRAKMKQVGEFLQQTKPTASKRVPGGRLSATTKRALSNIARLGGLRPNEKFHVYKVKGIKTAKETSAKVATAPSRYHLAIGHSGDRKKAHRFTLVCVLAKESGGRIVGYRIYHRR